MAATVKRVSSPNILAILLVAVLAAMVPLPASADQKDDQRHDDKKHDEDRRPLGDLRITRLVPDVPDQTIEIQGVNFGREPRVWVGTAEGEFYPLPVLSSTDSWILASLVDVRAASYSLVVQRVERKGEPWKRTDQASFTIGIIGPQGDPGVQGPQGEVGPRGADGADGATGATGATGAQGPAGADGAQGPQGIQGEVGPQGPKGDPGVQGPQGEVGPRGADGADGATGATGATGAQGPAGADGAQGPQGIQGETGPTGASGPQGPTGATGPQGPVGPVGPMGPQGPIGPTGQSAVGSCAAGEVLVGDGTCHALPNSGISTDEEGSIGGTLRLSADVPGPLNDVTGSPGDFLPEQHVLVVENQRGTSVDGDSAKYNTGGIAVVLHSENDGPIADPLNRINTSDNYVTFFQRDKGGDDQVVGRIEGVSPFNVADVFTGLASLAINSNPADLFKLDVELEPDWLTVDWPTLTGGSPGSLTHPGFQAPSFTAGSIVRTDARGPSISFNPGSLPSASFSSGSLPEIHWPGVDFANWWFDRGSLPSLSFYPGSLPSLSVDWGSLTQPGLGFTENLAELNWGSLGQSGLGLQYTPPTFPTLTTGAITQVQSPFKTFSLSFDGAKAADMGAQFYEAFAGAASFFWDAKSDPVAFGLKYAQTAFTAGVTYESGSGDYAEWLERLDPNEKLVVADVVGVHGDKITRKTEGANQVMVVSFKPIVLGNMPPEGRKAQFEKVAFLGQTLVKVRGVFRKGDLIVPSGFEDGTAIAVPVQRLPIDQWERVVGVAWADGGDRAGGVGLANIAVGMSAMQMAKVMRAEWQASQDRMTALEQQNRDLSAELEGLRAELLSLAAEVRVARQK